MHTLQWAPVFIAHAVGLCGRAAAATSGHQLSLRQIVIDKRDNPSVLVIRSFEMAAVDNPHDARARPLLYASWALTNGGVRAFRAAVRESLCVVPIAGADDPLPDEAVDILVSYVRRVLVARGEDEDKIDGEPPREQHEDVLDTAIQWIHELVRVEEKWADAEAPLLLRPLQCGGGDYVGMWSVVLCMTQPLDSPSHRA
jgi:hypothetical protein